MYLKRMRYLKNNNGSWYYQRRWPTKLKGHPQLKTHHYSRPLGVDGSDEAELAKAWQHQHQLYENFISLLLLANTDAINAKKELEMARAFLDVNGLKPGLLHPGNPLLTDEENSAVVEAGEHYVDSLGIFSDRERPDTRNLPQINVLDRAWKLLHEPSGSVKYRVITVSDCWNA